MTKKLVAITIANFFLVTATAGVAQAALWKGGPGCCGIAVDNDWFNSANWNGGIVPGNATNGTDTSAELGNFLYSDHVIIDGNAAGYEVLNLPGMFIATQSPPGGDGSQSHRLDILNGAQVNLTGGVKEFRMRSTADVDQIELNISGNSVLDAFVSNSTFLQSDGGNPSLRARLNLGDATSLGTFNISNGGNTFGEQQGGTPRIAPMTVQGVGAVSRNNLEGGTQMSLFAVKFVADGWGGAAGRVLDLSTFTNNNRPERVPNSDWGYYAQNGAELKMFTVVHNVNYTNVGDRVTDAGANMDKINSFAIENTGIGGSVSGSVLALDHPNVLAQDPLGDPIGAWTVRGIAGSNTKLSFRYDNHLATSLGVNEADLKLFMGGSEWVDVTSSMDEFNHIIYAEGLSANDVNNSTFAVALSVQGPVGLDGDYNNDGMVDAADYTIYRDNLGSDSAVLNGNGSGEATVVQADYALWKQNFGSSGTSSSAAIPEPSSIVLLLLGGWLSNLATRRRR
jgi:hypothetical protein